MTGPDFDFVRNLIAQGLIVDPVLELGGGYGGDTCKSLIESTGVRYLATDLHHAPGVDLIADFETGDGVDGVAAAGPFGTVLVLNVLEHTFNPIAVLENAVRVTRHGGRIVIIAPAIWPLHNYPIDCCRLLPDWYRRFAITRDVTLEEATFSYVGIGQVAAFRTAEGQDTFPPPGSLRPSFRLYSRVVHKLFNTFGRGMAYPSHIAIGATLIRSDDRGDLANQP